MAMNMAGSSGGGGRRGRGRKAVMAEINVTPMVDVMLVLLIIFMVAAPLLTVNIQVDLPQAAGGTPNNADTKPLELTVKKSGESKCVSNVSIYLGDTEVPMDQVGAKIKAMKEEKGPGAGEQVIKIRGDRDTCYSDMMKVLGLARDAGYRASIVVVPEQGT
jgi:biopolymer transport protein TolR